MRLFVLLWDSLNTLVDLDTRRSDFRGWLTREDAKAQRRITLSASLNFLSVVILMATTCDSGLLIQP